VAATDGRPTRGPGGRPRALVAAAAVALALVAAGAVAQAAFTAHYAVGAWPHSPSLLRASLLADARRLPGRAPVAFAGPASIPATYYLYPHRVAIMPPFAHPRDADAWLRARGLRALVVQRGGLAHRLVDAGFRVRLRGPVTLLLAPPA
jgi:hypothetical protein